MQFLSGFRCIDSFSGLGRGAAGLLILVFYKRAWDPRWIIYCATHIISYHTQSAFWSLGLLVLCSC